MYGVKVRLILIKKKIIRFVSKFCDVSLLVYDCLLIGFDIFWEGVDDVLFIFLVCVNVVNVLLVFVVCDICLLVIIDKGMVFIFGG